MEAANPGFFADIGAIAIAAAQANNAANPSTGAANVAGCVGTFPSALTAPAGVVLGASLFTPKRTGVYLWNVSFAYAISGAGTLTALMQISPTGSTAVAGGAATSGSWRVENGGTPVSITGGTPATALSLAKTAAGAVSDVLTYTGAFFAPVGTTIGLQFVVSSAVNLSSMVFSSYATEIL